MKTYIKHVPNTKDDLELFIQEAEEQIVISRSLLEKMKKAEKHKDFTKPQNNELFGTLGK